MKTCPECKRPLSCRDRYMLDRENNKLHVTRCQNPWHDVANYVDEFIAEYPSKEACDALFAAQREDKITE